MADAVTQGQFKRFLRKNGFVAMGKKNNRYVGMIDGKQRLVVFHYHKDHDDIPTGTLTALSKQLGISRQALFI